MGDEKEAGGGSWYKVPTWDGSPRTFRAFKREMSWWTQSLDLQSTKMYNLAARWLLRQSGIVLQRGQEFDPPDLAFKPAVMGVDPDTHEEFELEPEDLLFGINRLMKSFEEMNGKSALDKRGELRNQFYLELSRRPGERISEFCTRYRVMVGELKAEGVVLPSTELGWFLRSKLGLDPLREQLLERALAGKEEFEVIEREVLRLFKDLHSADPLYRQSGKGSMLQRFLGSQQSTKGSSGPTSSTSSMASSFQRSSQRAPSSTSSRFGGFRRPQTGPQQRQAYAAEVEEVVEEPQAEDEIEDEGPAPMSLEEVLQTEAEGLAEELESAAHDGVDASLLEDLEGSMETAAEALLTMREARNKISEVKKDRGYGRPATSGNSSPSKSSRVLAKKQSGEHRCWDCDLPGHWQGDPECKKPGAGLGKKNRGSPRKGPPRQVQIAEALEVQNVEHPEDAGHEALAVQHLPRSASLADVFAGGKDQQKEINVVDSSLARDKMLVGALDTACNRTCAGTSWLQSYLKCLEEAPTYVRK